MGYANAIVPEARGRAQRQLEEASAYQKRVVARAEGEAARFNDLYAEYLKAPDIMRGRLYIDSVSQFYTNSNKVLVDVEGGNNMMYLPLDKLIKETSDSSTPAPASLSAGDLTRLTNQVIDEIRSRQSASSSTSRRESPH